ncbi:hypothetical protein HK097_003332 [Rhizophlyctis rosea]|uniref:Uncharacterized protein n=1 Tax=Rhizophlyctis rosea TaxID=64517 RepID=A0AAD5X0N7_9FUNG|nr:hypothetical protein HK097_003332 [Rhizophlyctis rosea]
MEGLENVLTGLRINDGANETNDSSQRRSAAPNAGRSLLSKPALLKPEARIKVMSLEESIAIEQDRKRRLHETKMREAERSFALSAQTESVTLVSAVTVGADMYRMHISEDEDSDESDDQDDYDSDDEYYDDG